MNFLIISHALHKKNSECLYAYAPYVQEMNLWLKHVNKVEIVAPFAKNKDVSQIDSAYEHSIIKTSVIPQIQFTSIRSSIASLFKLPYILFVIFRTCKETDHIHLRCPGNIGLLGCFVQILFSKKTKTAKYAGNWDPNSKQPLSYRLQKWILKNRFLTKNMKVLVYGDWKDSSKNIVPFFTASYSEFEKIPVENKSLSEKINLLFVGTLSKGKRPLLAVKVAHELLNLGNNIQLDIYGEGEGRIEIETYVKDNCLEQIVTLHGNKSKDEIKKAYQNAHFLVIMSQSEGWPKVVAEAMFWKCLPISSSVSCVPEMLGHGSRGSLVLPNKDEIALEIQSLISTEGDYQEKVKNAYFWSRNYTLDKFELEISKLLK